MELFSSLGLNETIIYQFVIFFVAFLIVNNLIFKPYFKSFEERKKRTLGGVDQAGNLLNEAAQIEEEYSEKARKINEEIKALYEKSRKEAVTEQAQVIASAQDKTKTYLETAKLQIEEQIEKARVQIRPQITDVAKSISSQMLGR